MASRLCRRTSQKRWWKPLINHNQMPNKTKEKNWERFVKTYKPIRNFVFPTESFDGFLFDTCKTEIAVVNGYNDKYVWTLMECDGKTFLSAGKHFVNRLGYFICGKKWENKEKEIEI
jgi:hypothetical protein